MRSVAVAIFASASGARLEGERDLASYTYTQYQEEFGKNSNDATREAIFYTNMAMIIEHNALPDKTWYANVNEFTDWTNDEFKAHRTGHSPHPQQNVVELAALRQGDLPDEVDWRKTDPTKQVPTSGVVTKVKNQGSCGSCWAFSATETLESHLAIATGEEAPILSPQQIVSCAPNPQHCGGTGGCQGSTQPLAFNYTVDGITTDANYPYKGSTGTCDQSKITPVASNDGYVQLETNNYTALVTAVASKGPIAISVAAGGLGWQVYGGGVYSDSAAFHPFLCNYVMDHAVQLVGYGTDDKSGKMFWLVRNSWGAGWGESGYIRVERHGEGKEPCGTDKKPQDGDACEGDKAPRTYCGLCGILSSSSYPTGLKKVGSVQV